MSFENEVNKGSAFALGLLAVMQKGWLVLDTRPFFLISLLELDSVKFIADLLATFILSWRTFVLPMSAARRVFAMSREYTNTSIVQLAVAPPAKLAVASDKRL
ncbi:hypothetical protein E2542_SST20891 [Spatholobus suberectus]|nr:hypothetical protein E2542_SST20891 [Spatholobus suberectus]